MLASQKFARDRFDVHQFNLLYGVIYAGFLAAVVHWLYPWLTQAPAWRWLTVPVVLFLAAFFAAAVLASLLSLYHPLTKFGYGLLLSWCVYQWALQQFPSWFELWYYQLVFIPLGIGICYLTVWVINSQKWVKSLAQALIGISAGLLLWAYVLNNTLLMRG